MALLVGLAVALTVAAPAAAQDDTDPGSAVTAPDVEVLQVVGLFDHIVVGAIRDAIAGAADRGSQALILQVDTRGAVVSDDEMAELLTQIDESPIAVAVWVGPSGARLYGTPTQMLAVADVTGMAPGSRVGNVGEPVGDVVLGPALNALESSTVGLSDARELGIFRQRIPDEGIAVIRNMIDALDGYEKNGVVLETTTEEVTESGTVQRTLVTTAVFSKLGLIDQLFHTAASPPVTYLLLLIGLSLMIFEFYTAGIGIAAVVGAGCLVLACYGLAELPTRWWAIALIVAAMLAFAVDVQVGIPRFWTGVGIVLTIVGSLWLFEPISGTSLRPSWLALLAGIGGVVLTFVVGMPSMTRTRFATPTIGREWMIGSEGVALDAIDPDGIAEIGEGRWAARTNRATPIARGEPLRVASIDGITLEVEPLEGAARDYREMRRKPPE